MPSLPPCRADPTPSEKAAAGWFCSCFQNRHPCTAEGSGRAAAARDGGWRLGLHTWAHFLAGRDKPALPAGSCQAAVYQKGGKHHGVKVLPFASLLPRVSLGSPLKALMAPACPSSPSWVPRLREMGKSRAQVFLPACQSSRRQEVPPTSAASSPTRERTGYVPLARWEATGREPKASSKGEAAGPRFKMQMPAAPSLPPKNARATSSQIKATQLLPTTRNTNIINFFIYNELLMCYPCARSTVTASAAVTSTPRIKRL